MTLSFHSQIQTLLYFLQVLKVLESPREIRKIGISWECNLLFAKRLLCKESYQVICLLKEKQREVLQKSKFSFETWKNPHL